MTKYNIEGGVDFYSALYDVLDIPEIEGEHEGVCLITNEKLTDKHVKMNCGHIFNYEPLYKDLVNHKMKFNTMEGSSGVLGKNEIRCPYCRAKQSGFLPYYPELGLKLVEGVNTGYIPIQKCSFVWDNEHFDEEYPEDIVNPKTIKCTHLGLKIINDGTKDIFYCIKHNKYVLAQQAKALKEKQKQNKLDAKLKEKQDKANAKLESKVNSKNVVLSTNISIPIEYDPFLCTEILKSGDRKGMQCSLHKMTDHYMCKRHYNLMIKKNL
jgi:hypothetical protein